MKKNYTGNTELFILTSLKVLTNTDFAWHVTTLTRHTNKRTHATVSTAHQHHHHTHTLHYTSAVTVSPSTPPSHSPARVLIEQAAALHWSQYGDAVRRRIRTVAPLHCMDTSITTSTTIILVVLDKVSQLLCWSVITECNDNTKYQWL